MVSTLSDFLPTNEGSLPEGSSFSPLIRDYIRWAAEWLREPLPFENSIGGVGVSPTMGTFIAEF
jgi:hypothetical protein